MIMRWFSVVVVLFAVVGCSKIANVTVDELPRMHDDQIVSVILLDGRMIIFDSNSGRFNNREKTIVGNDAEGKSVSPSLDEIQYIQVRRSIGKQSTIEAMEPGIFVYEFRKIAPRSKIVGMTTRSGEVVVFDEHGGKVNTLEHIIGGNLRDGRDVGIPLSNVLYVQLKVRDSGKTALLTTAIVLGSLFSALIIAIAANPPTTTF